MKHRLLYNQRSRPLVDSRENTAFRHLTRSFSLITTQEKKGTQTIQLTIVNTAINVIYIYIYIYILEEKNKHVSRWCSRLNAGYEEVTVQWRQGADAPRPQDGLLLISTVLMRIALDRRGCCFFTLVAGVERTVKISHTS